MQSAVAAAAVLSYKCEYFNPAGSDFFVLAVIQYCKAFTVQKRIQCDSYVRLVDTRPPTAAQAALQPGAQESLEMLCIIYAHTLAASAQIHNFRRVCGKKTVRPLDAWHGA